MSSREELEAAHKKSVKALEGEKRAAIKKAKGTKGKKAKGKESSRGEHNTETDKAAPDVGNVEVARSRPTPPGKAVPRPAAKDTKSRITILDPSTTISWCTLIIIVPIILTPFPNVAVHIT